jgi:phage RecT family recombinase
MATETTQQLTPAAQFHQAFTKMESQFSLALPKHMPVERFMRVVLTAVNGNPDLLNADRQSLFESAMKAAQDGLLPDGREGALVVYNTNVARPGQEKKWIKKVQWMPMVAGILKKARNSGEIALITAGCVWGGDKFRYWIDDEGEHIFYEPADKQDMSIFVAAFAMAKLKDGTVYALRVTPADVEKMRNASKAKDGPAWKNWFDQMAQKGAIRRLSKRLPMSSDLDDLIRRDDELYDFSGKDDPDRVPFTPVKNPLADHEPAKAIEHDAGEAGGGAPAEAGSEAELEEYDLVIELDGKVTKSEGDLEGGCSIVDRRFEGKDAYFQHADQWREACTDGFPCWFDAEGNLTKIAPRGEKRGGAAEEAAGEADDGGGAEASDAGKASPAASQGPGKGQSGAKDAPAPKKAAEKPYKDGETFIAWLAEQLKAAKNKAAVQELWGATRQDRADLCSADQIEAAADLKNAAIERVNKAKR